ncbi:YdeI/OmpD-associated family protein [Phytoactinopolyspora limicola]|uniref:YdeI/OmpD-associated family protein n=1 Tax=Phytoactinopolyspora limicola TaxID=2715536 RepID=UPI0014093973|nr:YdeI/OmpD-associated family protein [Phytoactinopolyspora limicola]
MATFRTTLWASGGNNVGIVVPEEVVLSFDRGKRVPVVVTIDGDYTYRNTISTMGGQYLISFNSETRKATGRGAGDEVEVTLKVDDQPRTVEVPEALASALTDNPQAAQTWASLSYSKQRQHAESIAGAKTNETRQRRLAKTIDALTKD